jgi:probable rRNA maturation factor
MRKRKNFVLYVEGEEFPEENVKKLEKAMYGFVNSDVRLAVELTFVDGEEIQRLNRELRSIDRVTDVLSFPTLDGIKGLPIRKKYYANDIDEEGNLCIGSIAVCLDRAREQAEEYGHSFNRELHYLIVHGIMHCLGYDHEIEAEKTEMREKEEFILAKLGIFRDNA